ncbi:hypothetical protein [Microcoleus sp. Pol12B5]|uniref:hypothetical protein n=1 Tax=Microcoleus sp. Pol12B5 TaxID=3055396 RepID=UPI002FD571C6
MISLLLVRHLIILLALLAIGSSCVPDRPQADFFTPYHYQASTTMRLFIKLRDGFSNNTVTVEVNEQEVYRKSGVTTDLTISFADAVEVPVEESTVKLKVAVEGGQTQTKEIRVQETPFVDVWIVGGKMELRVSKEEMPML